VLKADAAGRSAALKALQTSKDPIAHAFWKKFRRLVIGAYYTTPEGFKDVGYIGNVPRPADPGPSLEVKAAVEAQLKTLNL
jgi:hypothetical protein